MPLFASDASSMNSPRPQPKSAQRPSDPSGRSRAAYEYHGRSGSRRRRGFAGTAASIGGERSSAFLARRELLREAHPGLAVAELLVEAARTFALHAAVEEDLDRVLALRPALDRAHERCAHALAVTRFRH